MGLIKLRSKRFCMRRSKVSNNNAGSEKSVGRDGEKGYGGIGEIKWEVRPGGMLVQKREFGANLGEGMISIRVSILSQCLDISIQAASTFRELKMMLSIVTNLEPKEQRLLYKGKERDDDEHLHMVGVRDKDKVLI